MNVSKEKVFNILEAQEKTIKDVKNWVWEVALEQPKRPWTMKEITLLQNKLSMYEELEFYRDDDILEIHTTEGNTVLQIKGLPNIAAYCAAEHFENIPHEWFELHTLSNSSINGHYNLNFESIVSIKKPVNADETSFEWKNIGKNFIQKREMGFIHKDCTFLIEMVRRSNDAYQMMKDADIASQRINWNIKVVAKDTTKLLKCLMFLYQEITGDEYPLTKQEQDVVLKKYMKLIQPVRDAFKDPSYYYLAPKPVTLELKNLTDPDVSIGTTSILKNYAVTDKADGERMLLYVDEKGEGYLIDSVFEVKKLNVQASSLQNSLFDGEYITSTPKPIFAIFDVYFIRSENIMKEPLMPTRYTKMELVTQPTYWKMNNSNVSIEIKKHIAAEGSQLFDVCKNILQDKTRPYNIDGLVFTPTDLPVFGYYPNQFKNIRGKSVSWDKVFKWKPPDQNTIDFLVKEIEGLYTNKETNQHYKRFKLYTGYDAAKWEDIPVSAGVKRVFSSNVTNEKESDYQPRLFKPIQNYTPNVSIAFIPINQAGNAVSMEGDVIDKNNTIVEMSYVLDDSIHPSLRWKANRVREDKTKMLKTTGSLTKTANDLSVALNIWQSIHEPVSIEHIIGQKTVPESVLPSDIEERMLGINDVYYVREIPRNHMLSVHMFNFHNQGIKSMLYSKSPKKQMLLELACGMAGDLPRWRDNNFDFILGVDLVKNNIEGSSGSYARFLKQREEFFKRQQRGQRRLHYPSAMFLVGDCALPLETGEAAKGKDQDSEKLLKMLYQSKVDDHYNYLNNYRMVGKATKQFDMVSCQFAIHYFFRDKQSIEGFLRNVSYNLKKDGIFIATFMDGKKVHDLINKKGTVEGKKSGSTVWAIQKEYKSFTKASVYGKLINVYLENTRHFIPEYLVHFDVLLEKARERKLELQSDGFFEATFNELYGRMQANDETRNKSLDDDLKALYDDKVQRQFSFLNRWVIFKKTE